MIEENNLFVMHINQIHEQTDMVTWSTADDQEQKDTKDTTCIADQLANPVLPDHQFGSICLKDCHYSSDSVHHGFDNPNPVEAISSIIPESISMSEDHILMSLENDHGIPLE